jgi:hypothetical protein
MTGVKISKTYSIIQNIIWYKIIQMISQHAVRHKFSPKEFFVFSVSPSARYPVIYCTLYHLQLHHSIYYSLYHLQLHHSIWCTPYHLQLHHSICCNYITYSYITQYAIHHITYSYITQYAVIISHTATPLNILCIISPTTTSPKDS